MQFGICNLSIVPLRMEPSDQSELISQVLFGEHFKVLEMRSKWSRVRLSYDNYEGWIDNKQFLEISENEYHKLNDSNLFLSGELIDFITDKNQDLITIPLGSTLPFYQNNKLSILKSNYEYDGSILGKKISKNQLINTAFMYLNTPYLWGGKTPFGIDCSGFTQMVYKLCGYKLLREASFQATQGEVLSFIEESEPGDLAFFDNAEGIIVHVGIIMKDNYIIHAHGKVRIDRLDHTGIYNAETKRHTHKLRVIKKIV
ncbi:MAG: C40 family peptidase [Urechidicola sp.]|nr:C40 family peptidase [Urechidicola sp.]